MPRTEFHFYKKLRTTLMTLPNHILYESTENSDSGQNGHAPFSSHAPKRRVLSIKMNDTTARDLTTPQLLDGFR